MFNVLTPLARFLVQQPIGDTKEHAAPGFNWYQYSPGSALKQLQLEMQAAIDAYDHSPQLEILLPIQASIEKLLDLA